MTELSSMASRAGRRCDLLHEGGVGLDQELKAAPTQWRQCAAPLPCTYTAFVAKAAPLPCVSTAFVVLATEGCSAARFEGDGRSDGPAGTPG